MFFFSKMFGNNTQIAPNCSPICNKILIVCALINIVLMYINNYYSKKKKQQNFKQKKYLPDVWDICVPKCPAEYIEDI